MKNIKFALLYVVSGVSAFALASTAFAQDYSNDGTYISLGGGASMPSSSNINYTNALGASANGKTTFDTGYILSGAVGYRWFSGVRTEVEFNYRRSDLNAISGATAAGRQQVMGLMGNILFEVGDVGGFRPYVGGGAGVGWNKWNNVQGGTSLTFPAGTALYNDRDPAFQWQGIAGVSHALSDGIDVFAEYRYIGLQNNKFASTTVGLATGHDDRSHNALAGVRFNF